MALLSGRARALLFVIFICLGALPAEAQRLPSGIHPENYTIWLHPDLNTGSLEGHEMIKLKLQSRTKTIVLNAVGLEIDRVEFVSGGKKWKGTAEVEKDQEMVNLQFAAEIPAGE